MKTSHRIHDGKAFMTERVEMCEAKLDFRQDDESTNPVGKKIEPKSMYCERLDETVV
jgi:cytochrome c